MGERTKTALRVLGFAAVQGLLGDVLLRALPGGPGLFLWLGCLALLTTVLVRQERVALAGEGRWLALAGLPFALGMAWRDLGTLQLLDGLAVLITWGLAAQWAREGGLGTAGIADYAAQGWAAFAQACTGAFDLLTREIAWRELPRLRRSEGAAAVGRGLLVGLPLLLLFGALFAAADAVFGQLVGNLTNFDLAAGLLHTLRFAGWTWVVAGALRAALAGRRGAAVALSPPARLALGAIELGVVLGLLNALFLAFVLVQFRYFFGGAALVQATTGMTYAEYARNGFFQLVWVAALVLPLLLLAHWLLRREDRSSQRLFRFLAASLIALLYVIMVSALQRMRLYQQEFGLTELRLYTTAFMLWLAVLFAWFAATVLRGKRERFAFGALVTGLLVLAALHVLGPGQLIVSTNAARVQQGQRFDAEYALSLGADGVPALVQALPSLSGAQRKVVARELLARWSAPAHPDWLAWNWSQTQAWRTVAAHRAELEAAVGQSR